MISDLLERGHSLAENTTMQPSPELEAFLKLCRTIYETRVADGTWPWTADSTNPEDMVDSEGNRNDL